MTTEASPLFQTTRWTLLEESSGPNSGDSLDELCRNYWHPVHAFLRRSGCPEADAQDLTQDFFLTFMEREGFAQAERGKGRFRSFLLSCVRNHFSVARKASTRQKRGGGVDFVEVNDELDVSYSLTPDEVFEKRWAEDLVERALANLREEWVAKDRPFKLLAPYLSGHRSTPPLSETAEKLGVPLAATKSAVHRLRKRFGELVKLEVSKSVSTKEDEEDELEYLLQLLSR